MIWRLRTERRKGPFIGSRKLKLLTFSTTVNNILWVGGPDLLHNSKPRIRLKIYIPNSRRPLQLLGNCQWQPRVELFTWRCFCGLHKVILLTPDFDAAILSKTDVINHIEAHLIITTQDKKNCMVAPPMRLGLYQF